MFKNHIVSLTQKFRTFGQACGDFIECYGKQAELIGDRWSSSCRRGGTAAASSYHIPVLMC